jgi:predicted MFS family arabinose efflux permease
MFTSTINLYKNAYSGLSKRIWLLAIVMLINRSGTMVIAFMTLYCSKLGYTASQGGMVVAIYGLGALVGAFFGGRISDKLGFYYVQFISLLCGGLLFLLLGQMHTYVSICICAFFLSMVNESFRPANASAIAHYSTPQNRTQSFALVRLAINIGWGIGSAVGGILASINYKFLFLVDGATNIVAAILLLLILPKVTVQQQQVKPKNTEAVSQIKSPYKDGVFLFFIAFKILFAIAFFQFFTTVPLFFNEKLHLSEFWIGFIMAMNGVLIGLVEMVIVFKLEGKKPYLTLMMYAAVLMALSFLVLLFPNFNGFFIASLCVLIMTIAEMVGMPFMNTFYISRSNESNRGQYAALYTMAWSAAQVFGSSGGSKLATVFGYTTLWWSMAGICVLAAFGYFKLQQYQNEKVDKK